MRHSHSLLGQGRGSRYRSDADTHARPRLDTKIVIRKCANVSNRMSATSLSFIFKTVFRRSQRLFWFFSVTRVANLALSNSFFLVVVAERNGRCTHNPLVTVSHVAGMSTNSEQVAGARASIPRSRDVYGISLTFGKASFA